VPKRGKDTVLIATWNVANFGQQERLDRDRRLIAEMLGWFDPGPTQADFTGRHGIVDFDQVVFRDLWDARGEKDFKAYVKYHLSDHRPMWMEFRVG
jgi:hypothetical protein